ncbi:hypothetical protein BB559_006634 [Furculomyces boomerangus]|uniref:Protein Asterix n=1 Tax=Furculomyces boomerangus TaxID=61424 RepID=A0A2T9Y1G5_9FUNG|nr:hypothetical protein BB559_006634 [Furculomyces boomerangus]
MKYKPFPGDPRDPTAVLPYGSIPVAQDGRIIYSTLAMFLAFATLIVKIKLVGWASLFCVVAAYATERKTSSDSAGLGSVVFLYW